MSVVKMKLTKAEMKAIGFVEIKGKSTDPMVQTADGKIWVWDSRFSHYACIKA